VADHKAAAFVCRMLSILPWLADNVDLLRRIPRACLCPRPELGVLDALLGRRVESQSPLLHIRDLAQV
jgi:hypothetical protein